LNFSSLIHFLLQLGKSSLQHELDIFFDSKNISYTKGALSQQRSKLKPSLFKHLDFIQRNFYYTKASHILKWQGFRLIGIDGSTLQLPYSEELVKGFGHFETRTENNRKVVLARISQAYDLLNEVSIDAQIEHYRTSELSLCQMHLSSLTQSDLLIMDRAYAAFWLMATLSEQKKSFLIRVKANRWKQAKEFLFSRAEEQIIEVKPSNEAKKRCLERGINYAPLKLRMVRVPIQAGEDHVLITNLIDNKTYRKADLSMLYRKRWPVEESFKLLKTRAELENLSGKTMRAVQQDFYRIIFRANLSSILSRNLTRKGMINMNKIRKRTYQLNRTQAYRKTQTIINIVFTQMRAVNNELEKFALQLINQAEILRLNRTVPRIRRYGGRPANFMAYKP